MMKMNKESQDLTSKLINDKLLQNEFGLKDGNSNGQMSDTADFKRDMRIVTID